MTDASPIPTGPSSDSPSRPSTRLGAAAETAPPVLAGVLETATSDSSIRPQDDLFRFVNGGWLATAEIPADRPSSGAFTVLRDEAEAACRQIVEELAEDFSTESSEVLRTNRGRVGALYAAFMDQKHLEKLGAEPLTVELTPVLAALEAASTAAKELSDEYISTEHLLIGLAKGDASGSTPTVAQ
ncbi:MAG: Clp protease N-terminal domain-containing protein [Neisseria elongata]